MSQITIYNGTTVLPTNELGTFTMTVPLSIESETRVFRDETLSLRIIANDSASQRWRMSFNLAPDRGASNPAPLFSIHKAVHNIARPFAITMPQHHTVEPELVVSTIDGAITLGTTDITSVVTEGMAIPVGRFISFTGHNKIYVVTASTDTSVDFYPPLRANLTDKTPIEQSPTINVFYSENDNQSITYQDGILSDITLEVVEAL